MMTECLLRRCVVLGSTGAIGREVVASLVKDRQCEKVIAVSRQPILLNADKIKKFPSLSEGDDLDKLDVVEIDWERYVETSNQSLFQDTAYVACCLGTTRKDAGSAEAFRRVDLDYVVNAASKAKAAKVPVFHLVSSRGASAASWFLYMKTKGEVEEKVREMNFSKCSIYRPGMLNRGDLSRSRESLLLYVAPSISATLVGRVLAHHAKIDMIEAAGDKVDMGEVGGEVGKTQGDGGGMGETQVTDDVITDTSGGSKATKCVIYSNSEIKKEFEKIKQ
eukprot:GHVN01021469.1.p1 GENE.GHVN01021469.1~~GHVN01021469.1.p1  ORF type:complete len:278 (+),score=56.79 GHVN01021469.1:61-894(+)